MTGLDLLNYSSQTASLIGVIPIFVTLYTVLSLKKDKEKRFQQLKQRPGSRPVVLIINISNIDIESQVRQYTQQALKGDILYIYYQYSDEVNDKNASNIMKDITHKYGEAIMHGTDLIHLFFKGPVALAAMVGDLMSNGMPVLVYHLDKHNGYTCWGPLRCYR